MRQSIADLVLAIQSKQVSARQTVEMALAKAKTISDYHALLSLSEERALQRADQIDAQLASGQTLGRLSGVPFVVKDNFLAFGAPTTAATRILENFNAPLQATAIEKLEAEGAICIGKANLDAFGHGGSTENSAFGPTKNAHDKTRVAGGSSGGSAVVTALDVVPFALGTDTGGSIRQPASFNGVYGMKPSYGAVSRFGVISMASSTDTVGCFATQASDVELVMSIMAGRDPRDMTTLPDFFKSSSELKSSCKIGVIRDTMTEDIAPDVRQATLDYIEKLRQAGHDVQEVDMPIIKYALATYYVVVPAEISSNLARYDGIRYGQAAEADSLVELYGRSRDQGFVMENKRRIMIGSYVLSSGYFDAYYQKAQKARTLLIQAYDTLFESCDILLSPVSPTTAFEFESNVSDPVKMYLADIMTVPPSLAGLPAISVPAGQDKDGLPVGVQLIAKYQADNQLLGLVKQMEPAHV